MKTFITILFCLIATTATAQDAPTVSDARIEALVKSIESLQTEIAELRKENANMRAMIRGNEDQAEGVPEIEVMKTPGQHVMHPQVAVPVYAKSQWITYRKGQSRVIELIRNGNQIVPVGSVIYGDLSAPKQQQAAPEPIEAE